MCLKNYTATLNQHLEIDLMKYYQKINLEYDKQQLIDIADKYMHIAQDGFTELFSKIVENL
jgi:hypothetical protein